VVSSINIRQDILQNSSVTKILSEFEIDNHQFLIVGLDDQLTTVDLSDIESEQLTEIGYFEIKGQRCAIVRVLTNQTLVADIVSLLTDRELQIAALVAAGHPNKQIASRLHISEWTVSTHLRRVFMKLGVDSRAAMVYRCSHVLQHLPAKLL
jgi:DNA-binding CsgD family transcriptional regulator